MQENKEVYDKLREEYTLEEIADFAMIPAEVDEATRDQSRNEFAALRMQKRAEMSREDRLLSGLLHIKYMIRSYTESNYYENSKRFGVVLSVYLELVDRKQKEFAEDINIHPSRLSRILKGKEKIGKKIAYRLEEHSGEVIPALYWWKLMQKDIEQEIKEDVELRELEKKHVKHVVYKA